MKEHMQAMEGGGMVCRHCGGSVDDDGYATEAEEQGLDGFSGEVDEPEQHESAVKMRKRSLADALDRRGG
jgi:hypothetical protein